MSNAFDEKMVADYLDGDSQFSRRYRAINADDVPADLDAAILAQAAVDAQGDTQGNAADNVVSIDSAAKKNPNNQDGSHRKALRFWTRMGAPIGIAASFVLVLSIMFNSGMRDSKLSAPVYEQESASQTQKHNAEESAAPAPLGFASEPEAKVEQKPLPPMKPVAAANAQREKADAYDQQRANAAVREKQSVDKAAAQTAPAAAPMITPMLAQTDALSDARLKTDSKQIDRTTNSTDANKLPAPFKKEATQELAKVAPPPPVAELSRQAGNSVGQFTNANAANAGASELNSVEVDRTRRTPSQPASPPITFVAEAPPSPSVSTARAPVPNLRAGSNEYSRGGQTLQDRDEMRTANSSTRATATSASRTANRTAGGATAPTAPAASAERKLAEKRVSEVKAKSADAAVNPAIVIPPKPTARQLREADATKWLTYIRGLRMTGTTLAADREWDRFVKAYPNHFVASDDRARP